MTDYTFPIDGTIDGALSLQCRFAFGSLTIEAHDDLAEAAVQVRPRQADSQILEHLVVTLKGSSLVVAAPRPHGGWFDLPSFIGRHDERDAVDIVVAVPTRTRVKVASFSAEVTARGRLGITDLSSGSSKIQLDQVEGDLRTRCGSGGLSVNRVAGRLTVKMGSCDVRAAEIGRAAEIALGSGDVQLGVAHGPVRMRSGSGSVEIDEAHGDVEVVTGSGSVAVGLPAGLQARLDAVTGRGALNSELPVSESPSETSSSISIRARTGRGDVTIRRSRHAYPAAS
ncbi:MAG: hypothetical protein QOK10_2529 [Pseudonocardiales bacterium]|jgi:DUF4097 and DUF4098 domain-containing protein YvlB|nr:hypothetical protein [Pseudonocardiales bacterium]